MDLGNPLNVIIHYFLIKWMVGLDHGDRFSMMSALVCMHGYTLDKANGES